MKPSYGCFVYLGGNTIYFQTSSENRFFANFVPPPLSISPLMLGFWPSSEACFTSAWHLFHNSWPRELKYLASAASLRKERPL